MAVAVAFFALYLHGRAPTGASCAQLSSISFIGAERAPERPPHKRRGCRRAAATRRLAWVRTAALAPKASIGPRDSRGRCPYLRHSDELATAGPVCIFHCCTASFGARRAGSVSSPVMASLVKAAPIGRVLARRRMVGRLPCQPTQIYRIR